MLVSDVWLPAGLGHAGHIAVVRGLPQADPAEAELAEVSARPATAAATVVRAGLVLGLAALPNPLGCLCHQPSSLSLEVFSESPPSSALLPASAPSPPPSAPSSPSSPSSPFSGLSGL